MSRGFPYDSYPLGDHPTLKGREVFSRNEGRRQRDFWPINVELKGHEPTTVVMPQCQSGVLRIDRLLLDPDWSRDVLVTLRVGRRSLERIPSIRFRRQHGLGVKLGWVASQGQPIEMLLEYQGMHETAVIQGVIDYTHVVYT